MAKRVVICGAGPGGATLALVLASRGIPVTLLERHRDFRREFRGEWLTPSGQTALEQMGLGKALRAVPSLPPSGAVIYLNRKEMFTTSAEPDFRLVSQPDLLDHVVKQASQFPSFSFEAGTMVRGVIRKGGRVVGVTGTRSGERVEFRADLVIAADGRASVLRRASGLRSMVDNCGRFDMLWFKAPAPPGVNPSLRYQFHHRNGVAFSHPHPDGVHQYGWSFPKGTHAEIRKRGTTLWADALGAYLPEPFAAHIRAIASDTETAFLQILSNYLTDWYAPGLLMIGDAAHPMSAIGGQGINMALRDAIVVSNLLGPVLGDAAAGEDAIDGAAQQVAPTRLPEIARIQELQRRGSKVLNAETKPIQFLMERVLPLLGRRAGPLLARGVGTTKEFSAGVTEVNLTFTSMARQQTT